MPIVDELLEAMPDVGLRLVTLGEHRGADRWGALVALADFTERSTWSGQGATAADALKAALGAAGCVIE